MFFCFQLPHPFSKAILDKMGLSALTSQLYYQELNQDEYFVHDVHLEQPIAFQLDFYRAFYYSLEVKDHFGLLLTEANQDNNI